MRDINEPFFPSIMFKYKLSTMDLTRNWPSGTRAPSPAHSAAISIVRHCFILFFSFLLLFFFFFLYRSSQSSDVTFFFFFFLFASSSWKNSGLTTTLNPHYPWVTLHFELNGARIKRWYVVPNRIFDGTRKKIM